MNPVIEFGQIAKQLARNPLGIIALFIVLVYGIAALLFTQSLEKLNSDERLPLIWFLMLFPVLVLVTFYLLVSRHHTKLYAPKDYQDRDGFFRAMTPIESQKKFEADIKIEEQLGDSESVQQIIPENKNQDQFLHSAKKTSFRDAYILAEMLVVRRLELELGIRAIRDVRMENHVGIDALFVGPKETTVVEVKFTRSQNWKRLLDIGVDQLNRVRVEMEASGKSCRYILALVIEVIPGGLLELRQELSGVKVNFQRLDSPIEFQVFELAELLKGQADIVT